MTEEIHKTNVLDTLKLNGFKVWTEVNGKHFDGKIVRIDAIVKPPFGDDVYFGIEFKGDSEQHKSLNYQLKHIKQSIDYSYSKFGKEGRRIYIFLSPNPFSNIKENSCGGINKNDLGVIAHLLNFFNIGILDYTKYGLSFILGGDIQQRVWTESEGLKKIGENRTWKIKVGSQ